MQILSSRARALQASGKTSSGLLAAGCSLRQAMQAPGPGQQAGSTLSLSAWLSSDVAASTVWWTSDAATSVVGGGTVGNAFTIVVVGDGFGADDQALYEQTVADFLLAPQGLFGHDFFASHVDRFRVVRISLTSVESGVGVRVYRKKNGKLVSAPGGKGFVVDSTTVHDTALGWLMNDEWALCWLEGAADSQQRLAKALALWVEDYNIVYVLLNSTSFGGCGGGGQFVSPLGGGVDWSTVAHELGHAVAGLGDEYGAGGPGSFTSTEPKEANLTTDVDRATLKWSAFVKASTPVPTGDAVWTAGAQPKDWDEVHDVGLFAGGSYYDAGQQSEVSYGSGLYRPALNCRMNSNVPEYCPVCEAAMEKATGPAPNGASPTGREEVVEMAGYVRLVVHHDEEGRLSLVSATPVHAALGPARGVVTGLVGEARVGERLVVAQPLPDVGMARSARGPGDPHHHTVVRQSFDYVLRVPVDSLNEHDLDDLTIGLLRVDPAETVDAGPGRSVGRRVASLRLADARLPVDLRESLAASIRSARA